MDPSEDSGSAAVPSASSTTDIHASEERRPLLPDNANGSAYGSFLGDTIWNSNSRSRQSTQQSNRSGDNTPKSSIGPAAPKKKPVKRRIYWSYYVPILSWLPKYTPRLCLGDAVAGLTLSCLLIPQSMSYASGLAKLDPVNGLFGVIIPAFLYSIFGTCSQLNVGPEAALSLVVGQTIEKLLGPHSHYSPAKQAAISAGIASAIVFEVGLITFLLGIFRLGFMDAVLSRALLRGFITAIGFVIFIEQMIPLLGLEAQTHLHHVSQMNSIEKLLFVIEHLRRIHRLTALISLVALVVLVSAKIIKPKLSKRYTWVNYVPEILIVVVVATVLTARFDWDLHGVDILGKVSAGAVHVHFPIHSGKVMRYALSSEVTSAAITIAIMGYVDSIVAGKQNASRFNYAISPNRELTALGIANLGASLISGTVPGYGSITRSRLAANAGARSPMSSFFTALFTLLATFFLLQYLYYLPKAVLACIISLVVYSILAEGPEDVMFFVKMKAWTDMALMSLTFFLTLFVSVQTGILVSVAISLVMIVRKSSRSMGVQIMGRVPGTEQWAPVDDTSTYEDDISSTFEEAPGVLIVRLRETLHFANAGALKERLSRLERYGNRKHHPADAPMREEAQVIVFHMQDLLDIDASAVQIMRETCENYVQRGVKVFFAHLQGETRWRLETGHVISTVGKDHVKSSVRDCLAAAKDTEPAQSAAENV